jgi:hypothetical protein
MRLGNVKTFWMPQPPLNPALLTSRPIYASLGTARKRSLAAVVEIFIIKTALSNTVDGLVLKRFARSLLLETRPTSDVRSRLLHASSGEPPHGTGRNLSIPPLIAMHYGGTQVFSRAALLPPRTRWHL